MNEKENDRIEGEEEGVNGTKGREEKTRCKTKRRRKMKDGRGGMMKRVEEETEGAEDGKIGRKGGRKNIRKELMRGRSTGK